MSIRIRRTVKAACVLAAGLGMAGSVAAQDARTLVVPGLERPVEVAKDVWGISHIYAETEHDLFFAQGHDAARDRLFQSEMWRRQATGTTAEILGPRAVAGTTGPDRSRSGAT